MDTASRQNRRATDGLRAKRAQAAGSQAYGEGHYWSFSWRLFLSVMALFVVSAVCFIAYQYQREKTYRVGLLDTRLQDFNQWLETQLRITSDDLMPGVVRYYAGRFPDQKLRVTIIDLKGVVLFDTDKEHPEEMNNHLTRPEIKRALAEGRGYNVRRLSESTGETYFYSATVFDDRIVRSALPYDVTLLKILAADPHYLWFTLFMTLLLAIVAYSFTKRLGDAISHLREFAKRADRNEPMNAAERDSFQHNELGEISQHIVQIYQRLRQTKEALSIEREKLLSHLQTSHEGLGVFTKEKKEILVNTLFFQYGNLISDHHLHTAEDIFKIAELQKLTSFIDKALSRNGTPKKESMMSINIEKDGRFFIVECNIFPDLSFEISIYDVTQEEEQARLKRQLTQNIAHELKTPVSSIQGYLETLVNNPDMPDETERQFLQRCYAQSSRLSRLLRDISLLTRMDEASQMYDMEVLDLHRVVEGIIGDVALELEQRHIAVTNDLSPGMTLMGNSSLLYSMFRNLMDNVIAYAGTDISVRISCFRQDDSFYYLSFADTGVGVGSEHLNRLFERFYRVDKGRSRKLGGTGLGLAIVKNTVLLHGGTISAKNRRGGGLEFIFTLSKGMDP